MGIAKLTLKPLQQKAYALVLLPAGVALVISIFLWPIKGIYSSYAVFLGGMIWALPSLLMAHFLFSNVSPRAAQRIVLTLYITEVAKLVLIAGLFILVSYLFTLPIGYVLLGYGAAMITFWVAPLVIR